MQTKWIYSVPERTETWVRGAENALVDESNVRILH